VTTDTKQLAEFAAEFLGWDKEGGRWTIPPFCLKVGLYLADDPHAKYLFEHPETAPILAHLAKREMEKRGFWWHSSWFSNGKVYSIFFSKLTSAKPGGWRELEVEHENEYIALWSAIQEAVTVWGTKEESDDSN